MNQLLGEQHYINALRHNEAEVERHLEPAAGKDKTREKLKRLGRLHAWFCFGGD